MIIHAGSFTRNSVFQLKNIAGAVKSCTFEKIMGMNAITIDNAISNFPQIVTDTIRNFEETVIVGEQGTVVLISQQEWNSIMETLRLFRDKKSLKALLEGHSARRKGQKPKSVTVNQAFYDLQDFNS